MATKTSNSEACEAVEAARKLSHVLRGRPDAWTAGVLAGMTSTWLAGWPPEMRRQILDGWIDLVRDLVEGQEKLFFAQWPAVAREDNDNDD